MRQGDSWIMEHLATLVLFVITELISAKDSPLYDAFSSDYSDMAESCLLYPVHSKSPSPSYLLRDGTAIAITVNHLQDSIVATLLLQTTSETCLLLVTKKDITVEGDCLHDHDEVSSLTLADEQEFLTILVEQREDNVRVYLPAASTHTIRLSLTDLSGGIHAQVSGVGPLNAAFDCFSGCLEVGNGTWVHSNGTLRLFVDPHISNKLEGTMSFLYGIDDREWKQQKQFKLSYDKYLSDYGDSKALVIQPVFGDRVWGGYYLGINKTLTKHRSGNIGAVPSKDLYVQFNNMNNFRWSLGCMLLNNVPMEEDYSPPNSKSKSHVDISSNEKHSNEDESSETSILFGHDAGDYENYSALKEINSKEILRKFMSFENYSEEAKILKDNLLESRENSISDEKVKQSRTTSKIQKKSKVVYHDDDFEDLNEYTIDDSESLFRVNISDENAEDIIAPNKTITSGPILISDVNTKIQDNTIIIDILNGTTDHEPEHMSTVSTGFLFKVIFSTGMVLLVGSLIIICVVHGCKKKDGPSNKYQVSAQSSLKSPSEVINNMTPEPPSYTIDNPAYAPDN